MRKKNVIITISYIILIILLMTFLLDNYRKKNIPIRCSGELSILLANNNYNLVLNATISIIGLENKKGVLVLKGNIKNAEKIQSTLNRSVYFTRIDKDKDIFILEINDKIKSPTDTTDDATLALFSINHTNLRMVSQIHDNTLLLHDTLSPQFICVKY